MSYSLSGTITQQRTINDESTRIDLIPDDEADGRIHIDRIHEYELIVDGGIAEIVECPNPYGLPEWVEAVLADFGVRGVRE